MACCRAPCSPAPRASCATRRRPPAICCSARAVPISTIPTSPATSASPAAAAPRSAASAASMPSIGASEACIATHPSDMAVAMRALDATVETVQARRRDAEIPIADLHRLPGDTPAHRNDADAGRTDHRGDAAEADRRQAYLPQGARPRVLRLRAGFRRRRSCSPTAPAAWRSAASRTSRGASRRPRPRCRAAQGGRRASLAGAKPTAQNAFKMALVERTLGAVLAEAKG